MKDRSIKEILLYLILIIMMVMSLIFGVKDLSNMDISYVKLGLYSIPVVICTLLISYLPIILLPVLLAVTGYGVYLYFYQWGVFDLYHIKISSFLYWLQGYIVGYEAFDLKYSLVFSILVLAFSSLIISILTISKKGSFFLIILGTAAHAFFWFMYVSKAKYYILLFLFASILLYAYKMYKKKNREWLKTGSIAADGIGFKWIANTSILLAISLTATLLLPFNIKPLRWEWLNDKVIDFFPFVLDWRNDAMDSYSYGFNSRYSYGEGSSKTSRLGGPIFLDDSVMITVAADGIDTLYLRGTVKDKYTGNSWVKTTKSYFQHKSEDTLAVPYNMNEVNTYKRVLSITPRKLLTSTIFAPYKIHKVELEDGRFFIDEDSEAYFSKLVTKKETYKVESIMPYINEEDLRKVSVDRSISSDYVQLPSHNISQRLKQLAIKLTAGYDNDFDKIKAIEQYLRTNYTYTLNPPHIPAGKEFVDYFIFEHKEGYCTYFASAMAVLLRAVDIPCRYVEGFLSEFQGSYTREVKGTSAHAWIEVYFEKYGWINFEATPAYSVTSFREREEVREVANIDNQSSSISNRISPITTRDRTLEQEEEEAATAGTSSSKTKKLEIEVPDLIKLIILAVILLRILSLVAVKAIKEILLKRDKGRKYINRYLTNIFWHFSAMGYRINSEETLREFSRTVHKYISEGYEAMPEVIEIIEGCMYGEKDVDTNQRQLLERYRKNIRGITLKRLGLLRFFWRVYILGI